MKGGGEWKFSFLKYNTESFNDFILTDKRASGTPPPPHTLYLKPSTEFTGYRCLLKTEVVWCMGKSLDWDVFPPAGR